MRSWQVAEGDQFDLRNVATTTFVLDRIAPEAEIIRHMDGGVSISGKEFISEFQYKVVPKKEDCSMPHGYAHHKFRDKRLKKVLEGKTGVLCVVALDAAGNRQPYEKASKYYLSSGH